MNRFIQKCVVGACLIGCSVASMGQENEAEPKEVNWLRSATEAARLAQQTGKPILIYVRSENCHYCDLLQKKTWQDPETQSLIMREMIPLKLTLEENKLAVEAMKVKGFPSTLLFSPEREYLARIDGFVAPEEFLKKMAKLRSARYNPDVIR